MEEWKFITVMVTVVAFALEIRPLDSFITSYLTGPNGRVTLEEVSNVLTPIQIYFSVFGNLLVFLLTDYLKYKPVVILNGLLGMVAYWCFTHSPSVPHLVVAECCMGMYFCTEVAYYSYLFAKIKNKEHYEIATGCAKAGSLSGQCASGLIGQLVVTLSAKNDYSTLPYLSLAGTTFAFVWACFLPSVKDTQYFYKDAEFSEKTIHDPEIPKYTVEDRVRPQSAKRNTITITTTDYDNAFKRLYDDFLHSYADPMVRRWAFWYIFSLTGYMLVYININILYTYVVNETGDSEKLLNGLVNSVTTLSGAICAYNISKLDVNWLYHGDSFLAVGSLALGLMVCLCGFFKNIICIYVMYIGFGTVVQSMFVISISQIAKRLEDQCFALILGFNAFLAISMASCWLLFLVDMIQISVPTEFLFYGGIYTVLGALYGCASLFQNKTIDFKQLP